MAEPERIQFELTDAELAALRQANRREKLAGPMAVLFAMMCAIGIARVVLSLVKEGGLSVLSLEYMVFAAIGVLGVAKNPSQRLVRTERRVGVH